MHLACQEIISKLIGSCSNEPDSYNTKVAFCTREKAKLSDNCPVSLLELGGQNYSNLNINLPRDTELYLNSMGCFYIVKLLSCLEAEILQHKDMYP